MEIIGSFEAKTHWSALLEKVVNGDEIIITRRGKAIARLVPETGEKKDKSDNLVEAIKAIRRKCLLKDDDWKAWRDEGRQ